MKRGGAGGSGAFVSACNRRSPFPINFQSSCIRPVTGGCDMRLDINTLTDIALPKHLIEALNVPCVYSSVLLLCVAPHALSHKHTPLDTHSFTPRVLQASSHGVFLTPQLNSPLDEGCLQSRKWTQVQNASGIRTHASTCPCARFRLSLQGFKALHTQSTKVSTHPTAGCAVAVFDTLPASCCCRLP